MTTTINRFAALIAVLTLAFYAMPSFAQEGGEKTTPAFEAGPYFISVGLNAGYRSTDVTDFDGNPSTWAQNRYYEAYNLRKGMQLNSFDIYGERRGAPGFFDELFVTANGLNDPFTNGSMRIRQFNSYDFKVDYRSAKYFLNRNDSIFTGLHKYDFSREFINAALDVHATDNITVNVKYNSISRDGSMLTTMSPSVEEGEAIVPSTSRSFKDSTGKTVTVSSSGTSYFGNMARGEFYQINVPKNDKTSEFSAGITAKLPSSTSISLGGGIRNYQQTFTPTLVNDTALTFTPFGNTGGVNGFSDIRGYAAMPSKTNPLGATIFEPLLTFNYTDHRESNGPFGYLQAVTRPADMLTVTADLRFESSTSKPTIDYTMGGVWRTQSTIKYDTSKASPTYGQVSNYAAVTAPWLATLDGGADKMDYSSLVGNVSLAAKVMDDLNATLLAGYSTISEEVDAAYTGHVTTDTLVGKPTLNATTNPENKTSYKIPQMTANFFLMFTPEISGIENLGIKAGVKYLDRKPDVQMMEAGVLAKNEVLSREVTGMTPYFNLNIRPVRMVKFDARFSMTKNTAKQDGATSDMPIRNAPEDITSYSAGLDVEPINDLNLNVRYAVNNGKSTFDAVTIAWTSAAKSVNLPALDYKNNMNSLTASVGYFIKDIKLGVNASMQLKNNDYSIPTTWTRGQIVPPGTPGYIDSMTTLETQNTKDQYIDFSLNWQPIESIHLDGGVSMLKSTGAPYITEYVPTGINPDYTHVGGPYQMNQYHGSVTYDFSKNVAVSMEYQQMSYKEDRDAGASWTSPGLFGLNNFKSSIIRGGFALKL